MEIQGYVMPEDLHYEEHHYWVRVEGDMLIMGMDDFAQKMAGDIVFVQLPFEGKKLTQGKKFSSVESGKWVGSIYAPVNGELLESNSKLEMTPTLINSDCYGEGWIFKVRPNDISDIKSLINGAESIKQWVLDDIAKYK